MRRSMAGAPQARWTETCLENGMKKRCRGGLTGRSVTNRRLHRRGDRVGVRDEHRDLPALRVRQRGPEARHAGEPDAVCHLPVRHAFRVIRDHLAALEQLWWIGEHPFEIAVRGCPGAP